MYKGLDLLDKTKWWFAIEMEMGRFSNLKIIDERVKLGGDPKQINSHNECGLRIEETTVFSDNFDMKYKLFTSLWEKEKVYVGTNWRISGGCHVHLFLTGDNEMKYATYDICNLAANLSYLFPLYMRTNNEGFIIRHRRLDEYYTSSNYADIKFNDLWSLERRVNEQVHWALVYYYLFLIEYSEKNKSTLKELSKYFYRQGKISVWNNDQITERLEFTSRFNSSDCKYVMITNNGDFDLKKLNISLDIRQLQPSISFEEFDFRYFKDLFIEFNEYLKQVAREEDLKGAYKFFSENMRGLPREVKRKLIQSLPEKDRRNWKAIFKPSISHNKDWKVRVTARFITHEKEEKQTKVLFVNKANDTNFKTMIGDRDQLYELRDQGE